MSASGRLQVVYLPLECRYSTSYGELFEGMLELYKEVPFRRGSPKPCCVSACQKPSLLHRNEHRWVCVPEYITITQREQKLKQTYNGLVKISEVSKVNT